MSELAGWGRYPRHDAQVLELRECAEVGAAIVAHERLIARGNGRSYGDSSIGRVTTIDLRRLNRFIHFDPDTGVLACEAGVLLSDVIDIFMPRGWFPPVTPGTKFVTIGGMIAADVHGKNHHGAGSFCEHLLEIDLAIADGTVVTCSREKLPELFLATCGGMGLTGVILRARFKLIRVETAKIRQKVIRAANLEEVMAIFEASRDWTYSAAWIDCLATGSSLGRSVVVCGEHAVPDELAPAERHAPFARSTRRPTTVPFDFPSFLLNGMSVRIFNRLYYGYQRQATRLVDFDPFFYPLDSLLEWNRIYGRRGFVQHQCVIPTEHSRDGLVRLLTEVAAAGTGSFLAVLKHLGKASGGYLSFPREGYTLALDFPANPATFDLLDRLDQIVLDHGGRLYLAKDARASARMFMAGYPDLATFSAIRQKHGLDRRFHSFQSERLGL
jgi:decaprenylphospho-beta-D-ribofuranose 2-oxidase